MNKLIRILFVLGAIGTILACEFRHVLGLSSFGDPVEGTIWQALFMLCILGAFCWGRKPKQ